MGKKVGRRPEEIVTNIKHLEENIKSLNSIMESYTKGIEYYQLEEKKALEELIFLEIKKKEKVEILKLKNQNEKYFNCDASTPTINLEEEKPFPGADFKGPFFGVPRDNQDGLGTCYANAAKNLLVGASGGKDIASFLDLAIQYVKNSDGIVKKDIDGGHSCAALEAIKKYGYCPREFSPAEMGEKNLLAEGLFSSSTDTLETQAAVITILGKYINGLSSIGSIDPSIVENIKLMTEELKNNPDVILPLPVLRFEVPGRSIMEEVWTWGVKKRFSDDKSLTQGIQDLGLIAFNGIKLDETNSRDAQMRTLKNQFFNDFEEQYKKFRPTYINAVQQGRSASEIFEIFKQTMKPFIDNYKLQDEVDSMWYFYKNAVEKDFKLPDLKKRVQLSLSFLRKHFRFENKSDMDLMQECVDGSNANLKFINNFIDLITKLKENKISVENIYNDQGHLKSATELIQLAVAPSCLNDKNRRSVTNDFICKETEVTNLKSVKERKDLVVQNLLNGFPVGNTFVVYDDSLHINTIVGIRYNPQSKRCELLIRESQTGLSLWDDADEILNRSKTLTEVRKK